MLRTLTKFGSVYKIFKRHSVAKSKSSQPLPKSGVKYALRDTKTGMFWNGATRASQNRYYHRRYRNPYLTESLPTWHPVYSENPTLWSNRETAMRKWSLHETERRCGIDIPTLEIVSFEMQCVETDSQLPKVNETLVRTTLIHRKINQAVGAAFEKIVDRHDAMEFRYAIKRRGKTKAVMDTKMEKTSFSYSNISFVKTEEDLTVARLILGSNFVMFYDLETALDITNEKSEN